MQQLNRAIRMIGRLMSSDPSQRRDAAFRLGMAVRGVQLGWVSVQDLSLSEERAHAGENARGEKAKRKAQELQVIQESCHFHTSSFHKTRCTYAFLRPSCTQLSSIFADLVEGRRVSPCPKSGLIVRNGTHPELSAPCCPPGGHLASGFPVLEQCHFISRHVGR